MVAPILCLLIALADPSEAALVRRTYDLSHIIPPQTPRPDSVQSIPLRNDDSSDDYVESDYSIFGSQSVLYSVVLATGEEEWEYNGRSIDLLDYGDGQRTVLAVVAPLATQAHVAKVLDYLSDVIRREAAVQVDFYRVTQPGPNLNQLLGRLGPSGAMKIQEQVGSSLDLTASFAATLYSQEPTLLEDSEAKLYLRDFDSEISEGASMHQPVPDEYAVGSRIAMQVAFGSDDAPLVTFAASYVWEDSPPTLLEAKGKALLSGSNGGYSTINAGGSLQSPSLHFAAMAGTLELRPGETSTSYASIVEEDGSTTGVLVAFTLTSIDPVPPVCSIGSRQTLLADLAKPTWYGFQFPRFGPAALEASIEDPEGRITRRMGVSGPMNITSNNIDYVMDWLSEFEDGESTWFSHETQFVTIITTKGNATQYYDQIMSRLDPTPAAVTSVAYQLNDGAGETVPLCTLSSVSGDAVVVAGIQETYILDNDVDVATHASIFNPIVLPIISGYAARGSATTLNGKMSYDSFVTTHLRVGGHRSYDSNADLITPLDQPTFLRGQLTYSSELTAGKAVKAGSIRIPSKNGSRRYEGLLRNIP